MLKTLWNFKIKHKKIRRFPPKSQLCKLTSYKRQTVDTVWDVSAHDSVTTFADRVFCVMYAQCDYGLQLFFSFKCAHLRHRVNTAGTTCDLEPTRAFLIREGGEPRKPEPTLP